MNETIRTDMYAFFTERRVDCAERERRLAQEQKPDESTLARIEGNIYDAFRAVFDVACRIGDDGAAFFRQRAKQIPSSWHAARQQALDHGCEDRAYVETVKLNAAECIMAKFESLLEAKQ